MGKDVTLLSPECFSGGPITHPMSWNAFDLHLGLWQPNPCDLALTKLLFETRFDVLAGGIHLHSSLGCQCLWLLLLRLLAVLHDLSPGPSVAIVVSYKLGRLSQGRIKAQNHQSRHGRKFPLLLRTRHARQKIRSFESSTHVLKISNTSMASSTHGSINARAQNGFAKASAYDAHRPSYPSKSVQLLLEQTLVAGQQGRKIVDLAAGTGKFTELLAAREERFEIIAVEPHDGMREVLVAKKLPNVKIQSGRADSIDLPDESVDAVIVAQVGRSRSSALLCIHFLSSRSIRRSSDSEYRD